MAEKPGKFGFNIKITEETSTKLKSTELKSTVQSSSQESPETSNENELAVSNIEQKELPSSPTKEIEEDNESELKKPDSANSDSKDEYSQYVHYEGDEAIYTDPTTRQQYTWCKEKNEWTIRHQSGTEPNSSALPNNENQEKGSYDFEDNCHTYTDADGSVYMWDVEKNAWFPKIDEDFLAHYQMAYGFVDNTSKDTKECEAETVDTDKDTKLAMKRPPQEPKWFDVAEEQNNKVYVSNLPLDITEEEFIELMQKCGLIMKDPTTQKLKIKLYTKPNSEQLKGDGLCTYIKVESVDLALNILDGYNVNNHRICVQRAKFQMKGEFNPTLKPKKKRRKDKEKIKKIQEKLFDWRPEKMRGERSKHERVVIIKNLFEPSLFDAEVHLILEYQQDLREECSKCGEVKKVQLYDRHPQGVAQIIMKEPEEADAVVKLINGRWFGKRQLEAEIWDGKTKYKMEETDADLNKRIDGWNKFLEDDTDKSEK